MQAATPYERSHLDSYWELQRSPNFEIHSVGLDEGLHPAISAELGEYYLEWRDVDLTGGLISHQLRFRHFWFAWATTGALPEVHGEIDVLPLLDAVEQGDGQPIIVERESHRRFHSQLRCIAGSRGTGNGHLTHLRLPPDGGSVEIWFDDQLVDIDPEIRDHPSTFVKLDLTYGEYMDALLATKGARGWELLFANIDLTHRSLQTTVANLRNMLEVFPALFPDHDYTPFRERLTARL
ncbi:hypothetical protein AB0M47_24120 [Hamadaea sp. NPDC051192]|uniref:hypothetical protein n=1 Tax=Hamadaea sp. NPDC051192 TaxID=3154940 RepID=UPI003434565C